MSVVRNVKSSRSEKLVDSAVKAVVADEEAWDKPIAVSPRTLPTSIRLSPRTIQRAKFFARIHHERGYQSWLKKIVEDRIDAEYRVYASLKKDVV